MPKKTVYEESKTENLIDYEVLDAGDSSKGAVVSTCRHTRRGPVSAQGRGHESIPSRTSTLNDLFSSKREVSIGVLRK